MCPYVSHSVSTMTNHACSHRRLLHTWAITLHISCGENVRPSASLLAEDPSRRFFFRFQTIRMSVNDDWILYQVLCHRLHSCALLHSRPDKTCWNVALRNSVNAAVSNTNSVLRCEKYLVSVAFSTSDIDSREVWVTPKPLLVSRSCSFLKLLHRGEKEIASSLVKNSPVVLGDQLTRIGLTEKNPGPGGRKAQKMADVMYISTLTPMYRESKWIEGTNRQRETEDKRG